MNIPTQQESKQSAEKHVVPINSKQYELLIDGELLPPQVSNKRF